MIFDLLFSMWAGWEMRSFDVLFVLLLLAGLFGLPDWNERSGLLRLAFLALGVSALFSLFGGDCDCDL